MTSKVVMLTREESTKYLGQMITFQQQETTEVRNRIRAAWAKFHKYRQELTSRNYMLRHRLRLFDAVETPTMNYASGTWTLTKEHERMIQSTQTQNSSTHHTNEKKVQKYRETKKTRPTRKNTDEWGALEMKVKVDKAQTHRTIRTATSFENDTDEEIDTTVIEAENWIDYTKKKHRTKPWKIWKM